MPAWAVVVAIPFAWALGTFPTAELVARSRGRDVTREGSGNPGASNVGRLLGVRAFVIVFAGDMMKGAIATGVGIVLFGRAGGFALGVAAVLGHMFPLYRKGGKGVATASGMALVLYPIVTVSLFVLWLLLAKVTHKASVASLVCAIAFPVIVAALAYDLWEIVMVAVVTCLLVARHASNIRRLIRGEEGDVLAPPPSTS